MRFAAALLLAAASLLAQDARDALNRGVEAFRSGRYADAVTELQQAVDLDPSFPTARLYLATALMQQYIPGADSPENEAVWSRADAEFRTVLQFSPNNKTALASLASLNFNAKNWDAARNWYKALINVEPNSAQAHYSLGVIAWSEWYPDYSRARTAAGMKPADRGPIPDAEIRAGLRARWWAALDEGIWNLDRALSLNPEYDDAMAYMNLILRERADLRDAREEYNRDLAEADLWVQKALDLKKGGSGAPLLRVQHMKLLHKTDPVYPDAAKQAAIQGTVRLSAVIDKQGLVKELKAISGHPFLLQAALDAAKTWIYTPTLLNNEPIEVQTIIDVDFVLPGQGAIPR
jgi:TonB family protein